MSEQEGITWVLQDVHMLYDVTVSIGDCVQNEAGGWILFLKQKVLKISKDSRLNVFDRHVR